MKEGSGIDQNERRITPVSDYIKKF